MQARYDKENITCREAISIRKFQVEVSIKGVDDLSYIIIRNSLRGTVVNTTRV